MAGDRHPARRLRQSVSHTGGGRQGSGGTGLLFASGSIRTSGIEEHFRSAESCAFIAECRGGRVAQLAELRLSRAGFTNILTPGRSFTPGAEARAFRGLIGTAEAMPFPKEPCEISSEFKWDAARPWTPAPPLASPNYWVFGCACGAGSTDNCNPLTSRTTTGCPA